MALVLGLVPSDCISVVVECMVADIRSRGNQQTAGDIGFAYLVEALAQQGRSDVLFDITNRHDIGSYGFILDRAWTSMPEAWDASTGASMNHCMLGHIRQWFYRQVAGIQNDPTDVGFKKIIIRPEPVGNLTWAKASYESPYGRIAVQWKRHQGQFLLDVTIPVNTTATIYIPTQNSDAVTESGKPWNQVKDFDGAGRNKNRAVLNVESGQYRFVSPFETEQQQ
jgi:alpha-L-rhamnosidase